MSVRSSGLFRVLDQRLSRNGGLALASQRFVTSRELFAEVCLRFFAPFQVQLRLAPRFRLAGFAGSLMELSSDYSGIRSAILSVRFSHPLTTCKMTPVGMFHVPERIGSTLRDSLGNLTSTEGEARVRQVLASARELNQTTA